MSILCWQIWETEETLYYGFYHSEGSAAVPVPVTVFGKRSFANIIRYERQAPDPRTSVFRSTDNKDREACTLPMRREAEMGMT